MPDLDDVTTSEVSDEATQIDDTDLNDAAPADGVETPDGFAIRDAKIAEQAATIVALQSENQALRAHNYDLLTAQAPAPVEESNNGGDNSDAPGAGGVDALYGDKG